MIKPPINCVLTIFTFLLPFLFLLPPGTKKHAETQLKELACRFEEVEDQAKKSVKKAMVKLEQRLREQEQDVGMEQQRHQETMKILKKNDR